MKTLFITTGPPYPARGGASQRWWQNINLLASRGPVTVLSIDGAEPEARSMPVAAEWTHIDGADFPARPGVRSWLARIFAPRHYPVPDVLATRRLDARLRSLIERVRPDVIVLSHWKNEFPAPLKRRSNVVLDMHNVESLIGTDVRHVRPPLLREVMLWRWRRRDRALVRHASRTWVCSESDAALIEKLDARLPRPAIVPNAVDVDFYADVRARTISPPPGLSRNGATVIFVGFYPYAPNRRAAMEIVDEIAPRVFAVVPHARFLLVGREPTAEMLAAARNDPRIVVSGGVDDVRQYLALADVGLVPVREGGGTRVKILECFASKIPVASTAKGAEGIEAVAGRDISVAETSDSLAERVCELLRDRAAADTQAEAAYDLVRRRYSWENLIERLDAVLPSGWRR